MIKHNTIDAYDIKARLVELFRNKYPDYNIIGKDFEEGCETPAFSIDVRLNGMTDGTLNIVVKHYSVYIVYLREKEDISEEDQYEKIEEITELLIDPSVRNKKQKMIINVGDRYIPVSDFSYDYTGKDSNQLEISFDLHFNDWRDVKSSGELMKNVDFTQTVEEE